MGESQSIHMAEKKQDFVVTDRRKFTLDGELRTETEEQKPAQPARPAETPKEAPPKPAAAPEERSQTAAPPMPPPPSQEAQQAQRDAYKQSGKQFESARPGGRLPSDYDMTFERLIASLYMTAMMQLGLMHEEGQQPMADIIGAKQTIDTIGLLQEKTKGNLSDTEQNLIQNCLYELRMAFVELTNAIARGPQDRSTAGGGK